MRSRPRSVKPLPGGSREPVHEIVARYLDRLNRGETLDPLEIVTEHPGEAGEVLERLATFVDLGALLPSSGALETRVEIDGSVDPRLSLDRESSGDTMSDSGHGACTKDGRRMERLERDQGPRTNGGKHEADA